MVARHRVHGTERRRMLKKIKYQRWLAKMIVSFNNPRLLTELLRSMINPCIIAQAAKKPKLKTDRTTTFNDQSLCHCPSCQKNENWLNYYVQWSTLVSLPQKTKLKTRAKCNRTWNYICVHSVAVFFWSSHVALSQCKIPIQSDGTFTVQRNTYSFHWAALVLDGSHSPKSL